MRKTKIILLLMALIPLNNLTSQTLETILQGKDYLEVLNSLSRESNPTEKLKNSTIAQIKTLAKVAYEAYEDDPIKVYKFISTKNKEWDSLVRNDKSKLNIPRVGDIQGKLWELIEQKISKKTYELMRIPYFIKARVISKDTSIYTDSSTSFEYSKVNIGVKVEDVIKGKKRFKMDDKFEFYYLQNWEKPKSEFKIDESYFLLLEPRSGNDVNFNMVALVTYIDCPDVVFEIKDGNLIDEKNYFGFGKENNWEMFKKKFNEVVTNIKEGK